MEHSNDGALGKSWRGRSTEDTPHNNFKVPSHSPPPRQKQAMVAAVQALQALGPQPVQRPANFFLQSKGVNALDFAGHTVSVPNTPLFSVKAVTTEIKECFNKTQLTNFHKTTFNLSSTLLFLSPFISFFSPKYRR